MWACLDHGHWGPTLHRSRDSDHILIGVSVGGVYETRDGGKTWAALRGGLSQENCYDLVFRHALDISGERLAFGTTTGNLYASDNGGEHWDCLSHHLAPIYSVRFWNPMRIPDFPQNKQGV